MRWPQWLRRHVDTVDEARAHLDELERRDPEIDDLSRRLREAQRRNHFSAMVADAIARKRREA